MADRNVSRSNDDRHVHDSDIADAVMSEINSRHLRMRPHAFFVAGTLLAGFGLASLFLLASWAASVALFDLRAMRPHAFLGMGPIGIPGLMGAMPWISLALSVFALAGGIVLLRRYDFSYRYRFAGVALVAILLVLLSGWGIERSGIPERMRERGALIGLYSPEAGDAWVMGKVASTTDHGCMIVTRDGQEVAVRWDAGARVPPVPLREGDLVRAVGQYDEGGIFVAEGIGRGKPGERSEFERGGRGMRMQ
jgi:hypothetical protein